MSKLKLKKQSNGNYGIDNMKKVLLWIIFFTNEGFEIAKDGKVSIWEMLGLIDNVADIPEIYKASGYIHAEYNDMDSSEKSELVEVMKVELDLPNDKTEKIIEKAFESLAALQEIWIIRNDKA